MINALYSLKSQFSVRIRSKFRRPVDFFSTASDRIDLSPPEIIPGAHLKALPGQLERVTQSPFDGNHNHEIEIARGAPKAVEGTKTYHFRDVFIAKNWLISQDLHEELCWPQSSWTLSDPEVFGNAILGSSIQGTRFFGHWLRDDCATNLLYSSDDVILSPKRDPWSDEVFYSNIFGLKIAKSTSHALVKDFTYIDDLANNSHKLQRIEYHRGVIRKSMQNGRTNEIVYISRGKSARGRSIDNESDLVAALERRGVNIVTPEDLNSQDFFSKLFDANLIISAEGSQCSHAIYALRHRAAGLLTLQPYNRFWLAHIEWVRLLGFNFGIVVSDPTKGEFWIDPDEVLRTLDMF